MMEHDIDGAIEECREAIRLNPRSADTHVLLGISLAGKGDRQVGLEQCRIAQELAPGNAQVHSACDQLAEALQAQTPRQTEKSKVPISPKTLCVVQANGNVVIKAEIEKKLLRWGRLTLVSSVNEADLILEVVQTGSLNLYTGEGSQAAASLRQRGSTVLLWSSTKGGGWSMKGFSDASVGRAIAGDLLRYLESRWGGR